MHGNLLYVRYTGCPKKVYTFKLKLAITYCSNCVKAQGFVRVGQDNLKKYGISIGYG